MDGVDGWDGTGREGRDGMGWDGMGWVFTSVHSNVILVLEEHLRWSSMDGACPTLAGEGSVSILDGFVEHLRRTIDTYPRCCPQVLQNRS